MSADLTTERTAAYARLRRRALLDGLRVRNAGVIYAFVALLVVLSIVNAQQGNPFYLREVNAANILEQAAPVAILAVFSTIVLVSGNFDLSIGSTAALSAFLVLKIVPEQGLAVAIAVALLAALAVGVLNGFLVQKVGVNSFIVTLGTLTAVRGLVLVLTDGQSVSVTDAADRQDLRAIYYGGVETPNLFLVAAVGLAVPLALRLVRDFRAGRASRPLRDPIWLVGFLLCVALVVLGFTVVYTPVLGPSVYMLLAITVVTWAVLRYTTVGRRVYAVGGNVEAARLSGIRVDRYKIGAFVIMALAAGWVGVLFAAKLTAINPNGLTGIEFTAITAAVLGGTSLYGGAGSVAKAVVGALFLFTLQNGFNVLDLGANYQQLVEGIVIIVAVAVYTVAERRRATTPPTRDEAGPAGRPEVDSIDDTATPRPTEAV